VPLLASLRTHVTVTTQYSIRALDPRTHCFEVRCTVAEPDPQGQRFRLPTWTPGSYLIREFARHFLTVHASCRDADVAIAKESKDCWHAVPCTGPLTVTAKVYAFDMSVRTAYLDTTRGYFNGASVFLCPQGREDDRCVVEIAPPSEGACGEWRVASTLRSAGAAPYGFGLYEATDYAELIDHPVEMSAFALASFTSGGAQHDIAVSGRQGADLARLATDLARVCQWQADLFAGHAQARAPFDRYLFQIALAGEGYGGLEHRSSTSLQCRRDALPRTGMATPSDEYLSLLGVASHEYFHSWNVKRIKPAVFVPYDLSRENYTRLLWVFEGFTSYYDDLSLVRSGTIGIPAYLKLLGYTITNVLRTPGRSTQSIAESSFDAWIKFYRPDENTPNAVVSYYAKGALVALSLDLSLRSRGRSLDMVMRELWNRYGATGRGVPEDGVRRLADEIAGAPMEEFFARYVDGTEDPPLAPQLADFGVVMHLRPALGSKDRGGTVASENVPGASLGARVSPEGKLVHVYAHGAAESAGLAAGDQLVAIDGIKATAESVAALLLRNAPGFGLDVHAFRRDELFKTRIVLEAPPLDTCYLTLLEGANQAALDRRRAWLGEA